MESRPQRQLPRWSRALIVVAHPDDETFGLGAVAGRLTAAGCGVHVLCFTHGEASTLNTNGDDLRRARAAELRRAGAELGVTGFTLLSYPDGRLAEVAPAELAAQVTRAATHCQADGLLVFDDNGITGHRDHQAATAAAVATGLPVLAWALPVQVASVLRDETGMGFAGQPPERLDLCVRVDRSRQRRAALLHASQISPAAVLWRRLQLQGDCEHLRWLRPPAAASWARGEPAATMITGPERPVGMPPGREGMPDAAGRA